MSLFTTAGAIYENVTPDDEVPDNILFTVEIDSDEELEEFLAELAAYNQESQQLWEQAIARSDAEEVTVTEQAPIKRTTQIAKVEERISLPGYSVDLGAYTTYDRTTDPNYGTLGFGEIYNIVFYNKNSGASVSNTIITDSARIDSRRTLAVNASMLVGVQKTDISGNASWSYYPITAYVEFYASTNSGTWYK